MMYLTLAETAGLMRCSQRTVHRHMQIYRVTRGKRGLRGYQPGGFKSPWKFKESDIVTFIETGASS